MKNKIEDLRNHLFAELERLGEIKKPKQADIDRAKAIAEVSKALIDTARVEVDHLRALEALGVRVQPNQDGSLGTGFIGTQTTKQLR